MDFEEFGYLVLGLMRTARESSEEMMKKLVDLGKKAAEEAERITEETRKTVKKVGLKEEVKVRPKRKNKGRRPKTTDKGIKTKKSSEALDQLIEQISTKK